MSIVIDLIVSLMVSLVNFVFKIVIWFLQMQIGLEGEDTLDRFFSIVPKGKDLYELLSVVGLFIALLIAMYALLKLLFSSEKAKNSHKGLIGRFLGVYFFIYMFPNFFAWFISIPTMMYDAINKTTGLSSIFGSSGVNLELSDSLSIAGKAASYVVMDMLGVGVFVNAALGLLTVFSLYYIAKSITYLLIEMIERYIVLALLVMTAGPAISTFVSEETAHIFKGWFTSFVSTLILMVINAMFLGILYSMLDAVSVNVVKSTALTYYLDLIMIFAVARLGQRGDEMLRTIGLTTIQTGEGLARDLFTAGESFRRSGIPAAASAGFSKVTGQNLDSKERVSGVLGQVAKTGFNGPNSANAAVAASTVGPTKHSATQENKTAAIKAAEERMRNGEKPYDGKHIKDAVEEGRVLQGKAVGGAINDLFGGNLSEYQDVSGGAVDENGNLSLTAKNKNGETVNLAMTPNENTNGDFGDKRLIEDKFGNKYAMSITGEGGLSHFTETDAPSSSSDQSDIQELIGDAATTDTQNGYLRHGSIDEIGKLRDGDTLQSEGGHGRLEIGDETVDSHGKLREFDENGKVAKNGGYLMNADGELIPKEDILGKDGNGNITKNTGDFGSKFVDESGQEHDLFKSGEAEARVNNETGKTEIAAVDENGKKYWAAVDNNTLAENTGFKSHTNSVNIGGVDGEGVVKTTVPDGPSIPFRDIQSNSKVATSHGEAANITGSSFEKGGNLKGFKADTNGTMKPVDFNKGYEDYKDNHAKSFSNAKLLSKDDYIAKTIMGDNGIHLTGSDDKGNQMYFRPALGEVRTASGISEKSFSPVKDVFSVGGIPTDQNGNLDISNIASYSANTAGVGFQLKDGRQFTAHAIDLNNIEPTNYSEGKNSTIVLGNSNRVFATEMDKNPLFSDFVHEGDKASTYVNFDTNKLNFETGQVEYSRIMAEERGKGYVDSNSGMVDVFKRSLDIDAPDKFFRNFESVRINDYGESATVSLLNPAYSNLIEDHQNMLDSAVEELGLPSRDELFELSDSNLRTPRVNSKGELNPYRIFDQYGDQVYRNGEPLEYENKYELLRAQYGIEHDIPAGSYEEVPTGYGEGNEYGGNFNQEWTIYDADKYEAGPDDEYYKGKAGGRNVIFMKTKETVTGVDKTYRPREKRSKNLEVRGQKGIDLSNKYNTGSRR